IRSITHQNWMIRSLLLCSCLVLSITQAKKLDRDDRDGESCGNDAVPYLIEIDHNGKPELFCDTPVCLEPTEDFRRVKRSTKRKATDYPVCNHELLETVCVGERE
ncbi:hypothetical protein PENTCL1PPCAC_28546, partial [Pristionchus entomophagus]